MPVALSPRADPCHASGEPRLMASPTLPPFADASRRSGEIRLLGYRLHPMTGDEVVGEIAEAVASGRRLIMANVNAHAMATMFDNPPMSRLLEQPDAKVMIDSMPMLFAAKLAGHRLPRAKRTTSLDFYDTMFRRGAAAGWRFGFVGATPETLRKGLVVLRERYPALDIDGRDGYFDIHDDAPGSAQSEIVAWLNERSHDVVIVGMGMPRQEEWIERTQHRVGTRVFLSAGAYLDYQAGAQRVSPRWLGQVGLEWVYRLALSPRRLSYRYLIEPCLLLVRLVTRPHPQTRSRAPDGRD
ncbi:WecB/TagA/CpsF family glycosyltransferase [Sphingomonas sp.]|uniref:WecB/TagA/CpsF family glycosyltransferase n=1 Tax=Sphingomonas sp. TaxID=28214 RepID=UPI003B009B61